MGKDRPIIFSSEMVKAVLESRKIQTRRVIKPQPVSDSNMWDHEIAHDMIEDCPYGTPGDRLWVREAWRVGGVRWYRSDRIAIDYRASPELTSTRWLYPPDANLWRQTREDADSSGIHEWEPGQSPARWRSPIHMPRWASRITLEITDVRVERVQDISDRDCEAEGVERQKVPNGRVYPSKHAAHTYLLESYKEAFRKLWNSINEKRGFGWDVNPWVWVVEFRKID